LRRTLAAACAAVLVSACAGAPADAGPTILSVAMADDWASAPLVREVIEDFEREHEDVRVQVQGAPFSQIPDLLRNAADLGEPYDLAHWHAFAAGASGLAEPIDDLWDQHGLDPDRYLEGAVDDVTWDDQLYGVPLDVNALVLLVDGSAIEDAGLTPDDLADADGFAAAARHLVDGGAAEYAIVVSASSWAAYGWIRAFGGDLMEVDDDGEVTFTFDDPRTVAALDTLQQLVRDGTAPPPFAPDLALDAIQAFTEGTTAMHTSGSWDLPVTRRAIDPAVEQEDVLVLPMPVGEGDTGTVLGGSSLFVPTGAAERELAFELMLALTEDEVALELAFTEGRLPAVAELYEHEAFQREPDLAAFVDELPRADVMPLIAYPQLEGAFGEALEAVLKQQQDAATAMAAVQRRAELHGSG
jgi:multiple sugar transport system substrate-binding protein